MKILPLNKKDQSPRRVIHEALNFASLFKNVIIIGFHTEKEKPIVFSSKCSPSEVCLAAVEMQRIAQEELKKK